MVEVQSKFDSSITRPLVRLQMRKLWWFFILFPIIFILAGVLTIFGEEPDLVFGIIIIAFGVFFLPIVYVASKALQKRLFKSMKIMGAETNNYFKFDENKIYQQVERGDEFKDSSEMSYKMLYKACETKSHFFVFISNMQTHVIPKKDIITGTPQDLANILSARLGKKYKVYKIK